MEASTRAFLMSIADDKSPFYPKAAPVSSSISAAKAYSVHKTKISWSLLSQVRVDITQGDIDRMFIKKRYVNGCVVESVIQKLFPRRLIFVGCEGIEIGGVKIPVSRETREFLNTWDTATDINQIKPFAFDLIPKTFQTISKKNEEPPKEENKLIIHITQNDIERAETCVGTGDVRSPVFHKLQALYPTWEVKINEARIIADKVYHTPSEVWDFIGNWRDLAPVEPFSFELIEKSE